MAHPTALAVKNGHERDKRIRFEEEGHIYHIEGLDEKPISVTTLIHHFFPQFNPDQVIDKMMKGRNWPNSPYFGKTKQQIKDGWESSGKEASQAGTLMHADIERFLNGDPPLNPDCTEFRYFRQFWAAFQQTNPTFQPYRTEWIVFDEDKKLAGSIDCVLSNPEGQVVILDWKRSKEIKMSNSYEKGLGPLKQLDNCNYWHYRLQLNIYRHLLETRYGKTVLGLYIVVLHPNADNFQIITMERYEVAAIWDELFKH
jgi:ATP-dependent exoDNAse (exonuclease V) beta subunit